MDEKITIKEAFSEVGTKSIDERNRVVIGDVVQKLFDSVSRVKVFEGEDGDILLRPVVEIPAKEAWLYRNKTALESVKRGLRQASRGELKRFDMSRLAKEK